MAKGSGIGSHTARIAIVTGQLSQGGAERQLTLLAQELQRGHKFAPVVFCLSQATEPYGTALSAAGVEWHSPPAGCRSRLRRLLWLIRQLGRSRYALVYGVLNTGNVYGGAAALISGLPLVASIRSANAKLPTSLRLLSSYFCNRARVIVANSPSCVASLRSDLHVQHGRVCIIPNAVVLAEATPDARHKLRQEWGVPEGACLVGTVASLKAEKRTEFFLQVAAAMHQCGDSVLHFFWIGEGLERRRVEESLVQLPPSLAGKIRFPGARHDVADCLAAFDAFVLTSAYEGLPGALLEAMAAGLPCVATNVPGTRDVLTASCDDEIGLLADAGDPVRFATALLELLRDTERMQRMGNNAQRHVLERYGLQTMVSEFGRVFRSVINEDIGGESL